MEYISVEFCDTGNKVVVDIPADSVIKILELPKIPECATPEEELKCALRAPMGTKRLAELACGKQSALIMVPDITRKFPLDIVLPAIIEELRLAGLGKQNIRILIGAGTHRGMTPNEMKEHFGDAFYSTYSDIIYNHEWWKDEQLVYIGTTLNGTPIEINRMACDADLKIAIGAVKPHRDAGWSGGAKMIQPGISGLKTTGYTHWMASHYHTDEILGKTENPVRREMEQIASQVGLDFIVNCVLTDEYHLSKVFAGDFVAAHRAACEAARGYFTVEADEEADIFICGTSASQRSMWSIASGPNWCEKLLKKGGTVVVFAQCPEGICDEHTDVAKYGYLPFNEVDTLVKTGKLTDLAAASHIQHGGEKLYGDKKLHCIIVSSGVSERDARQLHLEHADTPQEAVDRAFARYGTKARAYLYPNFYFCELIVEMPDAIGSL